MVHVQLLIGGVDDGRGPTDRGRRGGRVSDFTAGLLLGLAFGSALMYGLLSWTIVKPLRELLHATLDAWATLTLDTWAMKREDD
jgi:hypothetical protein